MECFWNNFCSRCRVRARSVAQMVLPLVMQWMKTTGHVFMMFMSPCSSQRIELVSKGQVLFFRPTGGIWHLGLSLLGLAFSVRYPWKESISMTSTLSWSVPLKSTFYWLVIELPANELQLPVEDNGDGQYQFKTSFINPFSARSYKTCALCHAYQVRQL